MAEAKQKKYTNSLVNSAITLFRPVDHIFFTIPLVVLGYSTGVRVSAATPSFTMLLILLVANILAISFAFAINEVEDAEDDKRDPTRKNPVARGKLTRDQALIITFCAFAGSLLIFYFTGLDAMYAGLIMLIMSFFYSYKPVRLKSTPIFDLVSHGLMLSGLIFLTSYLAVTDNVKLAAPIFLGVTLISVYGQFYNQVRDFKVDKSAKIGNSTSLLGVSLAKKFMYISGFLGIALLVYSFTHQLLPSKLLIPTTLSLPIALYFAKFTSKRDLRANVALSKMHLPVLVVFNTFTTLYYFSLYILR